MSKGGLTYMSDTYSNPNLEEGSRDQGEQLMKEESDAPWINSNLV